MKAHVIVSLKTEVLDPQGDAVRNALHELGFADVRSVRVGKYIELEVDRSDADTVKQELESMSRQLLCNPVIEDFRVEVSQSEGNEKGQR